MARPDRLLESDDLVKAAVGVEGSLNVGEGVDRAVGTSATGKVHQIIRSKCGSEGSHPNLPCASRVGEMAMESWKTRRRDS